MFKHILHAVVICFAVIGFTFVAVYFAVKFGFTNTSGIIDQQSEQFIKEGITNLPSVLRGNEILTSSDGKKVLIEVRPESKLWNKTYEWEIIKSALAKDISVIQRASNDSGTSARIIVTQLVVEQLRLFFSEREAFKKWFEPLKILGSQTQFSWGVMGMKEETAILVEQHLKEPASPYYLGEQYEHLLDFKTDDINQERFTRMTDQHDHYYSYLYAGLFIKQIIAQWQTAGFDIAHSPEIISTLYNLGFSKSTPNINPKSGGAQISIDNINYSFGSLGGEFYNSQELLVEFPR